MLGLYSEWTTVQGDEKIPTPLRLFCCGGNGHFSFSNRDELLVYSRSLGGLDGLKDSLPSALIFLLSRYPESRNLSNYLQST